MRQYFIALEPDENFSRRINNQKKIIRDLVGEQKYLKDFPHITLFILEFEENTLNIEKIRSILENISLKLNKFNISTKDIKVFYDDILTGGNSITYSFLEEDEEKLRQIHIKVVDLVKSLSKRDIYPYAGKAWIPHITLASIDKDRFEEVVTEINKTSNQIIDKEFSIISLGLYDVETLKPVKKWELN
jgi:2'-5' RNA ligase